MRELENRMVIDSEWGELEYGVPEPKERSVWDHDAPDRLTEPDDRWEDKDLKD